MGMFDIFKRKPDPPAGPDPVVVALIARLGGSDEQARLEAARELGRLGARAAAAQSALEEATCDANGDVCTAAADALSAIRRALL